MPLLAQLGLAWMFGIALAKWLNLPWPIVALAGLLAAATLVLYRQTPQIKTIALWGLALTAGAFRFAFFQPVFDTGQIAFYNDEPHPAKLTGLVVAEPDVRDSYINLRLQVKSIWRDGLEQPVEGLILVRAPRYPERAYGDRLSVVGQLETPPEFEDFSYKEYLARFGIHSLVRRPIIVLIEPNQGNPFWAAMLAFKTRASATINQILAEPYASLLNGILLGIETGIPKALYEQFNLTGTSHVIVISGSNISLIAGIFLLLGQRLVGARYAPPLAMVGIVIYTFLVGADAAVSRAAVMGLVWVLAVWVGRPGLAINSLIFSGLVLSLINPLILWDVGFQLSFLATLGLIVLVPPLERGLFSLVQRLFKTEQVGLAMALLNELLVITLAAQIITGPLIVYHFGRFSLVSLLSNLLILPVQPPIMIVGGLASLAGMLSLPLGQLLGWLVYLPLAWTVWMVESTARLPFASLDLGTFPFWLLVLLYTALGVGVWGANRPDNEDNDSRPRFVLPTIGSLRTRLWLGGFGAATILVWLAVWSQPDGRLHVAFLDVGQGDAILITLPHGDQVLIDGGPSATDLNWRLGQEMPFWDRTLELVVNTHPDADHLAGLPSLLDRYTVEQVLTPDVGADSLLYREWEAQLAAANVSPVIAQAGQPLNLGHGLTAALLSPGDLTAQHHDVNNHSVVLYLQYGQVSFLFSGDIESPVESALVRAGLPQVTVLKSPHHGSKTSSSEPFLKALDPRVVVISVGAENNFGHPSPEVLDRYSERGLTILRTDQHGTIELTTNGEKLWVETDR